MCFSVSQVSKTFFLALKTYKLFTYNENRQKIDFLFVKKPIL